MESLMRLTRTVVLGLALALLGGLVAGARGAPSRAPEQTVGCDRIVLQARSGVEDGFRILLDSVSIPGAGHLERDAARAPGRRWPYYRNAGLAIRAGATAVSVSVPEGWRDRLALSWGGARPSSTVRFAPCAAGAAGVWNAFSGGIHLRAPADCVPLLVRVGGLSTTMRVGVGRACGAPR
jgi:hypothetical protein